MKNWSQRYFQSIGKNGLTKSQHIANNKWFRETLASLPNTTLLKVLTSFGIKFFNNQGLEMDKFGNPVPKFDCIVVDLVSQLR